MKYHTAAVVIGTLGVNICSRTNRVALFFGKNVAKFVVCCSGDWRFKGL